LKTYAALTVKKEKLEMMLSSLEDDEYTIEENGVTPHEGEIILISEEIENYDTELTDYKERIETLEEKLSFLSEKANSINEELIKLNPDDAEHLIFKEVNSISGARACLSTFFNILLEINIYNKELESTVIAKEQEAVNASTMIEELKR
jgi:chromosome segregation ATPase